MLYLHLGLFQVTSLPSLSVVPTSGIIPGTFSTLTYCCTYIWDYSRYLLYPHLVLYPHLGLFQVPSLPSLSVVPTSGIIPGTFSTLTYCCTYIWDYSRYLLYPHLVLYLHLGLFQVPSLPLHSVVPTSGIIPGTFSSLT